MDNDVLQDEARMNTNDIETHPACIPSNQKLSLAEENESKDTAIDHTIDEVKLRTQLHCEQNKLQSPR